MNNDLYAPPRAVVADVISGPLMARPWQVTLAVYLAGVCLLLPLPGVFDAFMLQTPAELREPLLWGFLLALFALLIALYIVLFVSMARGYRWARIVYSALTLWGLVDTYRSISDTLARAWYFVVLDIGESVVGAATLWLLFTSAANAWFRTRGGRIEPH
jgi:hypothetical protein